MGSAHLRLAAVALLVGACTLGSGTSATEIRDVAGFEEVVLATTGEVVVEVTGTESLEIEAETNLLPLLTSEVQDGRLELGATGSFTAREPIVYRLTAQRLTAVTVRGSGTVRASGVQASTFAATVRGSGLVEASGDVESLAVVVDGSGEVRGGGLRATSAEVLLTGSGEVGLDVVDRLDARVDGSGRVRYLGDPVVVAEVDGSGDVGPE